MSTLFFPSKSSFHHTNSIDPSKKFHILERISYLSFSVIYISYIVFKIVQQYLVDLHSQIRDEKYLIGLQLQNVDATSSNTENQADTEANGVAEEYNEIGNQNNEFNEDVAELDARLEVEGEA